MGTISRQGKRSSKPVHALESVNDHLPPKVRRLISHIQEALSIDLLSNKYRPYIKNKDHYTRGHCYVATEALYYLFGEEAGFRPHVVRCDDGGTHRWLQNDKGQVADPTDPQVEKPFEYGRGRCVGYWRKEPSARAGELIRRVHTRQRKWKSVFP